MLILVEYFQMFFEEFVCIEKQIIKVHGARLVTPEGVVLIDVADFRSHVGGIVPHQHRIGEILLPGDEPVFRSGDTIENYVGFILCFVQVLNDSFFSVFMNSGRIDIMLKCLKLSCNSSKSLP